MKKLLLILCLPVFVCAQKPVDVKWAKDDIKFTTAKLEKYNSVTKKLSEPSYTDGIIHFTNAMIGTISCTINISNNFYMKDGIFRSLDVKVDGDGTKYTYLFKDDKKLASVSIYYSPYMTDPDKIIVTALDDYTDKNKLLSYILTEFK